MGKIISDTWASKDDPIYKEGLRSYSPHWARALLKSKKTAPPPTDGSDAEQKDAGEKPPGTS
jgi:hypothetical protein